MAAFVVFSIAFLGSQAQKNSIASGNYNDPAIWNPVGVPNGAELVVINAGNTVTLTANRSKAQEEELIEQVMDLVRGLKTNKAATIEAIMNGPTKGFRAYLADLLSTNYPIEDIRILGSHKIHTMRQAETGPLRVINGLGASSPAYGMMGTLMGLIVILGNFDSAAGLASGLAIALMTTFYGLIMAQFVWHPLGKKLLAKTMHDQMKREVELEAVLLTMMNKPELFIIDQLSSMVQARDGASTSNA